MNPLDSLLANLAPLWQRLDRTTASWMLASGIALLFADSLLPLIGHGLHMLNEVLESIAVHFLEHVFHLHKRQADLIVFWCSFIAAAYLLWRLGTQLCHRLNNVCLSIRTNWRSYFASLSLKAWLWLAFSLLITGKLLFLCASLLGLF
ncbi:MAG: hypothetical protein NTV43_08835 [Methylococcales bacterium]|nr:hypothetical protein [Methylococcales bacterium]